MREVGGGDRRDWWDELDAVGLGCCCWPWGYIICTSRLARTWPREGTLGIEFALIVRCFSRNDGDGVISRGVMFCIGPAGRAGGEGSDKLGGNAKGRRKKRAGARRRVRALKYGPNG